MNIVQGYIDGLPENYGSLFVMAMLSISLLFLLVSIGLSLNALRWSVVVGVVKHSFVKEDDGEVTTYTPEVLYDYVVNGTLYSSSRLAYGVVSSSGFKFSEKLIEPYKAGKEVEVFYNPKRPKQSVLVRGFTCLHAFFLISHILVMELVLFYPDFFLESVAK